MNKKGFTLIELLATLVIMGIILIIAVPSYFYVAQATKEKAYESKKLYIEAKAESYATENEIEPTTITVIDLLNLGYIEADSDGRIDNPLGGYLDCYQIVITKNNGEYTAELKENNDCDSVNTDEIVITAYSDESKPSEIKKNNWTNTDVILYADLSNYDVTEVKWIAGGVNEDIRSLKVSSSMTTDYTKYANAELVKASVYLNTKYTIQVTLKDGTIKTGSYNVKIDKEKPVVTNYVNNIWTKYGKMITLMGSDGDGSGVVGFYVTDINGKDKVDKDSFNYTNKDNYTVNDAQIANDNSAQYKLNNNVIYYGYVIDKAGNISDYTEIIVYNIDNQDPSCYYNISSDSWTDQDVTLIYGCQDTGSGCKTKNKAIKFTSYKKGKITWTSIDNVGLSKSCSYNYEAKIDKEKPTISAIENPLKLIASQKYDFVNNVTTNCGASGCIETYCTPEKTNGSKVKSVKCTVKNGVGTTAETTFNVIYGKKADYDITKKCIEICYEAHDCDWPASGSWRNEKDCKYNCDESMIVDNYIKYLPDRNLDVKSVYYWYDPSTGEKGGNNEQWCRTWGDLFKYKCPGNKTLKKIDDTYYCF